MITFRVLIVGAFAFAAASAALAQAPTGQASGRRPPSQIGKIISIDGPEGSVIVVRGAQAYALQPGDALFQGDRVVTRGNGSVTFSASDCERQLGPTTSLMVDTDICTVKVVSLDNADPLTEPSGVDTPQDVGATPLLLPGLLATGAAASALSGSGSSSSVSP